MSGAPPVSVPVRGTRITPFGTLYDIVAIIDGLKGSTHPVTMVWLVADERPRGQRLWGAV